MEKQVLFITICTKGKNPDGNMGYTVKTSILNKLNDNHRQELKDTRKKIQSLLGKLKFDGILVDEENKSLQCTEDFGGSPSDTARYLPAYERYNGRFYNDKTGLRVIGEDGLTGFNRIFQKNHHLLILSGLYGIVEATELIQNYSCPIDSSSINLQVTWRSQNILAEAIVDYINFQKNNKNTEILRVFDLTGMKIYRDLVDWEYIHAKTGAEIFHLYHKKLAGDGSVELFGRFFRDFLLPQSTNNMLTLKQGADIFFEHKEPFRFSSSCNPPKNWASESVGPEQEVPEYSKILHSYQEAIVKMEDAVRFAQKEEYEKMKDAVDTGSKKLGTSFETALHYLLPNTPGTLKGLIRAFKDKINPSELEQKRLDFYIEIRNKSAHDYHTQLWDYCGFVQFFRYFLIKYLRFSPTSLRDPIEFLTVPSDDDNEVKNF